jgi:drug/metabolite transporter (DMT)-like permease
VLALSVWLLHERVNRWEALGVMLSFVGVIISVFVQPSRQGALAMDFRARMP